MQCGASCRSPPSPSVQDALVKCGGAATYETAVGTEVRTHLLIKAIAEILSRVSVEILQYRPSKAKDPVLPIVQSSLFRMVAPSGTYDAIAFPVALPKGTVNDMLPDWLKDQFQSIPDAVYGAFGLERKTKDGQDTHIIVVQLGYQRNTGIGPSFMRQFKFHEAKIDIPFLKHYCRRHIDADAIPFAYKQVMCVDRRPNSCDLLTSRLQQHLFTTVDASQRSRHPGLPLSARQIRSRSDALLE
jgi:hypothetical protein